MMSTRRGRTAFRSSLCGAAQPGDGAQHPRQPDAEFAALAEARALRRHAAAMHFDQQFDDGEPHAETALRPVERTVTLQERIEQQRQQLRVDADARIAHADERVDRGALDDDFDARPLRANTCWRWSAGSRAPGTAARCRRPRIPSPRPGARHRLAPRIQHRLHGLERGLGQRVRG